MNLTKKILSELNKIEKEWNSGIDVYDLQPLIDDLISSNDKDVIVGMFEYVVNRLTEGKIKVDEYSSLTQEIINIIEIVKSDLNNDEFATVLIKKAADLAISHNDYYLIIKNIINSLEDPNLEEGLSETELEELEEDFGRLYNIAYEEIDEKWIKEIIINFLEKIKLDENNQEWRGLAYCGIYAVSSKGLNDSNFSDSIFSVCLDKVKSISQKISNDTLNWERAYRPFIAFGLFIINNKNDYKWSKEIYKLGIDIAIKDPEVDSDEIENEIFSMIDFYGDDDNLKEFDREWIDGLRKINKPDMGQPSKILFSGSYYNYYREFMSLNEIKMEIGAAIDNDVDLEEYILDGFFTCDYGVDRYFDDSRFVIGSYRGGIVILEDSNSNIITRFDSRSFKTKKENDLKVEIKEKVNNFKLELFDSYLGKWNKYSLDKFISKKKPFDKSLITFVVHEELNSGLYEEISKVMYNGNELENYDEIRDARGKSTEFDICYIYKDKDGKIIEEYLNPNDNEELLNFISKIK